MKLKDYKMKKLLAAFGIALSGFLLFILLITLLSLFPVAFFMVVLIGFGTWFAYGWIDECTEWFK